MKIGFADGEKIGVYENENKTVYESHYITKYKENALKAAKSKEWKKQTDLMIEGEYYFEAENETEFFSCVQCVSPTLDENKLLYSFTVGETSGIYYKYTDDKEKTEAHALSSSDVAFSTLSLFKNGETLGSIQTDSVCSNIVIFKNGCSEYETLTGGDSFDENPFLDADGNVLFNSYAVGRDQNNAFITYLPAQIYQINPKTLEIIEIELDEKFSYIKPMKDREGNLYCIRKPGEEKREENVFLQVLMIPVRIVQAIVGFISAFVMCFAKKPLVSGETPRSLSGGEATKRGDAKKMWVNNHLINVEKELKKNKKSEELGFIPKSWTLVRIEKNKEGKFIGEYELARGVADYCLVEENGETLLVYTNGKRVFALKEGENDAIYKKCLFETDFCVKVNALQ